MNQPASSVHRGIRLDADAVRDEIQDCLAQNIDAHGIDEHNARLVLGLDDDTINKMVLQLVDDEFWQAFDALRSNVISTLILRAEQTQRDQQRLAELNDGEQETLDELVHDAASQAASTAINSGQGVQFLIAQGWSTKEILDRITEGDGEQETLDELVHDAASQAASTAINSGQGVQFLIAQGWSTKEILDRITEG